MKKIIGAIFVCMPIFTLIFFTVKFISWEGLLAIVLSILTTMLLLAVFFIGLKWINK